MAVTGTGDHTKICPYRNQKRGKKGSERKTPSFVKAQVPKPILPHSFSNPSLVAQVLYRKFSMGMPYDRQEKDWYRPGLVLSRADMAYRTIRCSEEWFLPFIKEFTKNYCLAVLFYTWMKPESSVTRSRDVRPVAILLCG